MIGIEQKRLTEVAVEVLKAAGLMYDDYVDGRLQLTDKVMEVRTSLFQDIVGKDQSREIVELGAISLAASLIVYVWKMRDAGLKKEDDFSKKRG